MTEDHPPHGFRPSGPDESRRIPPHGPVSPDGRHAWPQPSRASRLIVYGGVALAAAGLTAGAVLLGRKLAGSDAPAPVAPVAEPVATPKRRRSPALRLADLTHAVSDATSFIGMALAGFRAVAANAQGLGEQFRGVADAWREGTQQKEDAAPGRDNFREPDGDERLHRL